MKNKRNENSAKYQIRKVQDQVPATYFSLYRYGSKFNFCAKSKFHRIYRSSSRFEQKKPLVFATLTIENTNHSTITNSEGHFALKVPNDAVNENLIIGFLGYKTKSIPLSQLDKDSSKILMDEFAMALSEARIDAPNDAKTLVMETLNSKGENYLNKNTVMTAFTEKPLKAKNKCQFIRSCCKYL